jgi:hypothetical protein
MQVLSLRLDVATPSPPPKRDEEDEPEEPGPGTLGTGGLDVGASGWSHLTPGPPTAHISPTAPPAFRGQMHHHVVREPFAGYGDLQAAAGCLQQHGAFPDHVMHASRRGTLSCELSGLTIGARERKAGGWQGKNPFLMNMELSQLQSLQALKLSTSDESAPLHSFSSGLSASLRRDIEDMKDRRGAVISTLRRGSVDSLATIESWQASLAAGGNRVQSSSSGAAVPLSRCF